MEKLTINLGNWFGYPIYLHWSWTCWIGFLLLTSPSSVPHLLALFGIVLLHEFGHCFAAKYFDWHVHSITLYPVGGAARMDIEPRPWEEFVVAVCGPLVNIALIWPIMKWGNDQLVLMNYSLLIFNLLPLYPLDGGRIFRAVLELLPWPRFKRLHATKWAVYVGRVGWVLLAILAIYVQAWMLLAICLLMGLAGWAELEMERKRAAPPPSQTAMEIIWDAEEVRRRYDKYQSKLER